MAISVLSLFSLSDCNKVAEPGLLIFSVIYFLILYIGTHMIASSDELNKADKSNNQTTINQGHIDIMRLKRLLIFRFFISF